MFSAFPRTLFVDRLVSLHGIERYVAAGLVVAMKNKPTTAGLGLGHWSESRCRRKENQQGGKEAGQHHHGCRYEYSCRRYIVYEAEMELLCQHPDGSKVVEENSVSSMFAFALVL
jgi:hypothetical protein